MVFNSFEKNIILKYSYNIFDTGSTELQIIFLTIKINKIYNHLSKNKKDIDNKKNMMLLKSKRSKLLKYLKKKKVKNYYDIIKDLKIDVVER